MIHVLATIELQPGTRDEFLKVFQTIVPKVHAEVGCIEYGAAIDLATGLQMQQPLRDNAVMIIEKWEDLPKLQKHLGAPHMLEYRQKIKGFVKGVTLQILQPV